MNAKKELKKSIFFVVLAVSLLFLVVPMASASDWGYKKAIEIDYNKVVATLTNFPVLISMTDADLRDDAQDDGDDIAFFLGTTQLAHEINYFDNETGELVAWVNVPTLSSTSNTTIYMYYGNAACESQENVAGVWDTNYKMVQHLDEVSGMRYDSTANNNDGTPYGGNLTDVQGKIGGANEFHTDRHSDGSDTYGDYINCGNDSSLNITGDITIEAWVKNIAKWNQRIVTRHHMTTPWYGYSFGISLKCINAPGKACYWYSQSSQHKSWVTETVNERLDDYQQPLVWHHIAIVVNGATGNFYRDGISSGAVATNVPGPFDGDCVIGALTDGSGQFFNGTIDEVRISDTARSADWIETSYNNQNDPSSFTTVGDEQEVNDTPGIPEFPTMSLPALITIAAVFLMYRRRQRQ